MVKVFVADGGTLDQLRATLRSVADTSDARLADLEAKVDVSPHRTKPTGRSADVGASQ